MNISRENATQHNAYIKIELEPADYRTAVADELKAYRKKVHLNGFRAGMVPAGLIKKMYGKAILAEEVNKIISNKLQQYIADEKLEILGQPISARDEETVADFENPDKFVFWFEIGLAPEFKLDLGKLTATRYQIKIDDAMVDKYADDIRRRYGQLTSPEKAAEEDLLGGELVQLGEDGNLKEGGLNTKTSIAINTLGLKTLQKKFIGKSVGDAVDFPVQKAFKNATDLAAMLHISKEEAEKLEGDFRFTIESVSHIDPAELNEDLYKKVYPSADIKDEAGFKDAIRNEAKQFYSRDTDRKFMNDVIDLLVEKTEMELPEEFLKRWILQGDTNRKPGEAALTPEIVEKEFPMYANSIKWQLIESRLIKDNDIDIKPEDLRTFYRERVLSQYFPVQTQDEETNKRIDRVIDSMMQNQEEIKRVYDAMMDEKMTALFLEKVKQNDKAVSYDEFVALLNPGK